MNAATTIQIVCATDHNYVMPAGIMMSSLSWNNMQAYINFNVLIDNSVTEKDKKDIEKAITWNRHKICFYLIDNTKLMNFPGLHRNGVYQTAAAYDRLFLTDILPKTIDKVLYLDDDIIVKGNIMRLWNTEMSDCPIAAVTDMSEGILDYNRLGYPQEDGYFNSGVALINLKYWREHNALKTFLDIINSQSERIYAHDQDVLNMAFHENKIRLPFTCNVQHGFYYKNEFLELDYRKYESELNDARENPLIIHFTGKKPWKKFCNNPGTKTFLRYLRHSPWKYYKRQGSVLSELKGILGKAARYFNLIPPKSLPIYREEYKSN